MATLADSSGVGAEGQLEIICAMYSFYEIGYTIISRFDGLKILYKIKIIIILIC